MNDLDEVKKAQEEVSRDVHLLRQQNDKLEKEKIGPSELKCFEERLTADMLPKIETLQKQANDILDTYEETQKAIEKIRLDARKQGHTDDTEMVAKSDVWCMLYGVDNPLTGTKWQDIAARNNRYKMEHPLMGIKVPQFLPIDMKLRFVPDEKKKQLFKALETFNPDKPEEAKGSFISTDVTPGSHLYMLDTVDRNIQKRLYETNNLFPYVSSVTIGGDTYTYIEETGDFTTNKRLERGDFTPTEITDFKEHKIGVHKQIINVPFTQKAVARAEIIDPESYIVDEGTRKINRYWSYRHITGNGVDEPEGFLNRNVGRGGEVPLIYTGVAADLFADFEGFFDVVGKLSQPYRARTLRWFANFLTIIRMWKYKDAENRYYISEANPFRLRGYEIIELPGMPDIGPGSIPIAFGDLSGYKRVASNWSLMIRDEVTRAGWIIIYLEREEGGGVYDPYSFVHVEVGVAP